jgi:hypothetical protein
MKIVEERRPKPDILNRLSEDSIDKHKVVCDSWKELYEADYPNLYDRRKKRKEALIVYHWSDEELQKY